MKKEIKLIALDLDDTYLDEEKGIPKENELAVGEAIEKGVYVVVSTGRSLTAIPMKDINRMGVQYAITANGAEIHKLPEQEVVFSDGMEPSFACEIIEKMQELQVHTTVFIEGICFADKRNLPRVDELKLSDVMKDYMRASRTYVDDLITLVKEKNKAIQKFTLQFYYNNGKYWNYDKTYELLKNDKRICLVTGGYHNLEFSKYGVSKGNSLRFLTNKLGIDLAQTMACGDTQNDIDILQTAGIGVAVANATEDVKAAADYTTLSNNESGVAHAIRKFVLG